MTLFFIKMSYFCTLLEGDVAQLVEQRTENPCVDGSIPPITTKRLKKKKDEK